MAIEVSETSKVNIGCRFYGEGNVVIGSGTWIGPNCSFYTGGGKGIYIGNNCDIAPDVSFICGSHIISDQNRRAGEGFAMDVVVGDGTWIGALSGIFAVSVGKGAVIGAASVVIHNVDDNSLNAGVPAKKIRDLF
jgi:maltose O-acetyltransferase